MNASLITFKGISQSFIASQAPLKSYIPAFWQMVAEKKVNQGFKELFFGVDFVCILLRYMSS